MAGNLTGLHVFANDVSPEPLSLLDTNYSALNAAFNALINFSNYYVDTGIANAMAIAVTANQTVSYADGLVLQIQVAASNTGATTLNVAGIGPKNVVDQAGNALPAGMLLGGSYITVIYRATANNFQLLDGGQFAGGSGVGHNPTALVGLAAVNGTAVTFMRSDAAPPIDQSIAPTWTSLHTFTKAGEAILVNSASPFIRIQDTGAAGSIIEVKAINLKAIINSNWTTTPTPLSLQINGTEAIGIGTNGNVTIAAPSIGTALTVNTAAAALSAVFTDGTVSGFIQASSTLFGVGTSSAHRTGLWTNNIERLTISSAGAVTINAPSSAVIALTITGQGGTDVFVTNDGGFSRSATFNSTHANGGYLQLTQSGGAFGQLGSGAALVSGVSTDFGLNVSGAHNVFLGVNGTIILKALGTSAPTLQGYGPVNAGLVDMTPDQGSWTTTLSSSFVANPNGTLNWVRIGSHVRIFATADISGTSNGVADFSASGLPAAITPAHLKVVLTPYCYSSGNIQEAAVTVNTGGTLTFQVIVVNGALVQVGANSWGNAGTKGIKAGFEITYSLG
jgi:hypothetical protein